MKRGFHPRRAKSIARKEVMHILRDPFTMVVALVIPVFLTIMFGFAINFDIRNVHLAFFDADLTRTSRHVQQTFTNSTYFKIVEGHILTRSPDKPLAMEKAKISLVIPHGFEQDLGNGRGAHAQVLLDGADNTTVGLIMGYVSGINQSLNKPLTKPNPGVTVVPRFLFNPEQTSSWFIVPGLSVVILSILSILLTALTIAREWENGSMELLLSTPATPAEIIVGKLSPYVVMGFVALAFIYVSARLVFGIPFTGSYVAYILGSLLFLATYLSMGLLFSIISKKQQLAMQMSLMAGYMPSMLLSGFIFSIQNMTPFWQWFTALMPARWYMTICRACYLKGAGVTDLVIPFAAMLVLGTVFFALAKKRFRGDLES
jgi:ABC-2 type transport system permease protein